MNKVKAMKSGILALAASVGLGAVSGVAGAAELSGNMGVYSKYVLRGMTNDAESDSPAVQGGLDYSADNGLYAGYWASSLDYGDGEAKTGFENDFYVGFAGEAGGMSYDIGLIQYSYVSINDADGLEVSASVGFGPVSLGMKYLTNDVVWGNAGDTYWTLSYETELPKGFNLSAVYGYYTYEATGEFDSTTGDKNGFRHLDLTLSHPIGKTGADMTITYIVGGKDRNEVKQDNTMVLGMSYGFDI